MKNILGIDIGYGDVKVITGTSDGQIHKKFKYPSVIGITKRNEYVNDSRIFDFNEHSYYVGDSAMNLPSDNLIDITQYKNLEYYAPLFLGYTCSLLDIEPDIIVTGLSKAQIKNSGHFKAGLQNFELNSKKFSFDNVFVLPQGAGSKLCINKYGNNFPNEQSEFTGDTTFVGCDIGFNTLDMFLVTDGKTSPTLFEGLENEGIMKVAKKIARRVKEEYNRNITLHEAKEILDTGAYKLRGKTHDFSDFARSVKKEYLKELLELVESKYGNILDKCDFISLSGGGSAIFNATEDGFISVPKTAHEFYNSIGFYLFGCTKAQ